MAHKGRIYETEPRMRGYSHNGVWDLFPAKLYYFDVETWAGPLAPDVGPGPYTCGLSSVSPSGLIVEYRGILPVSVPEVCECGFRMELDSNQLDMRFSAMIWVAGDPQMTWEPWFDSYAWAGFSQDDPNARALPAASLWPFNEGSLNPVPW